MSTKRLVPATNLRRVLFGLASIILFAASAFNLKSVAEFGITSLVFGILFAISGVFAFLRVTGREALESKIPPSLAKTTRYFALVMSAWLTIGLLAAFIFELDGGGFEVAFAMVLFGVLSVTVWGTAIFVVIVLPIWGIWRIFEKRRERANIQL